MSTVIHELGARWARNPTCPTVDAHVERSWWKLLTAWVEDNNLPLLIRKSSLVRSSEITHATGRNIVPCDNAPAQWACHLSIQGKTPSISDIHTGFKEDSIPVSFAHKSREKNIRKYHCTLGRYSVNKAGWKLCHIKPVGLRSRTPLMEMGLSELESAFVGLLNPSNYFLLPIQWGGLGEAQEVIEGYANEKKRMEMDRRTESW